MTRISETIDVSLKTNMPVKSIERPNENKNSIQNISKWIAYNLSDNNNYQKEYDTNNSGFHLSRSFNSIISPVDASDILKYHNYQFNRKLNLSYASCMDNLDYLEISFAILPNGTIALVNGQHRLAKVALENKSLSATISIFQCLDNDNSLSNLFDTFDSGSPRSFTQCISHSLRNEAVGNKYSTASFYRRIVSGIIWAESNFSPSSTKKNNTFRMKIANRPITKEFASMLTRAKNNHKCKDLETVSSMCALYAMWISNSVFAESFTYSYFSGANLEENNPILKIREWMNNRKISSSSSGSLQIKYQISLFYSAWNAFISNRSLKVLKTTKNVPNFKEW